MVLFWGGCCQVNEQLSAEKQEVVDVLDSPDGDIETACSSGGPSLLDVDSDLTSFQQFCEDHQLEVDSGLVELMEGCPSCVSENAPGEPLVWVSDEFLDMVGWQRSEVIGRPCNFLQGENTTAESRAEVRRLIDSKKEGGVSLMNYTKQGKEFENVLYICPLYSNGECRFYLGSQMDIRGCLPQPPQMPTSPIGGVNHVDECQVAGPESMLQIRVGSTVMLANQGPLSFDNEWITGSLVVCTKHDSLSSSEAALFEGPSRSTRVVAVKLEFQFKKVPENMQWYAAGEIDGAADLSFSQRVIANFLLNIIKCWDKSMTYSFGSESSKGFISSRLSQWVELDGPIVAGKTYCWETGSAFIDLENWQVVNVPRARIIALTPFWGKRPLRVVLHAREGKEATWTRALEVELYWRGHQVPTET